MMSKPMTAPSRSVTTTDSTARRELALEIFRSTAMTVPLCRSVTEFNRLIFIICLHSPDGKANCYSHFRYYLAEIFGVKFFRVDLDAAKRVEDLDRQFEPGRKFLRKASEF